MLLSAKNGLLGRKKKGLSVDQQLKRDQQIKELAHLTTLRISNAIFKKKA
jgi:hypothetical protein